MKQQKGWRMSFDEVKWCKRWRMRLSFILQPFCRFTHVKAHSTALPLLHLCHRHYTYVKTHSPTLPLLYLHHSSFYSPSIASPTSLALHLRHSSFSNPSATLPMSQLILQPFCCFTYLVGTSPTSHGEPPMPLWWCLIYPWWFCNLQWLRPARLYERCKLALELKRLKTPALEEY